MVKFHKRFADTLSSQYLKPTNLDLKSNRLLRLLVFDQRLFLELKSEAR